MGIAVDQGGDQGDNRELQGHRKALDQQTSDVLLFPQRLANVALEQTPQLAIVLWSNAEPTQILNVHRHIQTHRFLEIVAVQSGD